MANPGWVFVPTNINYFIKSELEDHQRRENHFADAGEVGQNPKRICPRVENYLTDCEGLYDVFVLRNFGPEENDWQPGRSRLDPEPKAWPGDPMSSLWKSFHALGFGSFLPSKKLLKLSHLYENHDLRPDQRLLMPKLSSISSSSSSADDALPARNTRRQNKTGQPRYPNPARQNPGREKEKHNSTFRHQKRTGNQHLAHLPAKRVKTIPISPWAWGPLGTSNFAAKENTWIWKIMRKQFPRKNSVQEVSDLEVYEEATEPESKAVGQTALPSPENSQTATKTRVDRPLAPTVIDWLAEGDKIRSAKVRRMLNNAS